MLRQRSRRVVWDPWSGGQRLQHQCTPQVRGLGGHVTTTPPPQSGLRKSSWLDQPSVSHGLRGGGLEDGCDPIGGKALSSEMHPHLRLRTVRFLQAT